MKFDNAASVENIVWQCRLSDWPRANNRALIAGVADGYPPYTPDEVRQNNINFNVNFLELTKITHDARRQFYTGMISPDPRFTVNVDYGPMYRKQAWSQIITKEINKIIKRSDKYTQTLRSVFALDVLHGIGPSYWDGRQMWRPKPLGVEDVLIPSGTYIEMDNLPFFAIYRQYTGNELRKLTTGPNVDKGWNLPLVNQAIKWVDQQAMALLGQTWPEVWSTDKWEQRNKEDSGLWSSDKCPTIDCYDFYWWSDEKKNAGWKRRIVLDAWGSPGIGGAGGVGYQSGDRKFTHGKGEWLYTSGDRNYAEKMSQIVHFQFADASSVAPFRYHSVRSLGFLLYSVCQLQNRLRCKFTEAAFESMMQYFRVDNPDDVERALSINLVDKRPIPNGVKFMGKDERWQTDLNLIESVIQLNRQSMADNSGSFTQDFDFANEEKRDETATRTMAKVNSTAAMVGAMLQQAYDQQHSAYAEISRRFCQKNSRDGDVREFRVCCLRQGVPEEALEFDRWDIRLERVIGGGNRQMQMAMMNQAMAVYDKLNPEAQQKVLRMWLAVNLDDYALAVDLVPPQQHISDSVHDAQQSVGTIMSGGMVSPKPGLNITETIETWLHSMAAIIQRIGAEGVPTEDELRGLQNLGQHIAERLQLLGQDPTMKQKVKQYGDDLGNMMNLVKAFAQRLAEKNQQQNGNGQIDPKDVAKAQVIQQTGQLKNQLAQQKHAMNTAQKSIAFEQKLRNDALLTKAKVAATDVETAAKVKRNKLTSVGE